jgi:hypothetical protein
MDPMITFTIDTSTFFPVVPVQAVNAIHRQFGERGPDPILRP